ncbi:UNVERIFIED_CONTAM: hypothetical protein Sradi_3638400 [Sesamum radiatum]|uniref:Endonuclease/exonuclease/phosphatase domain-containing protein n=1 Tax=Sesamum radiatum TaxID=300843 RepID=A0AAW2QI49_SESRA
MSLGHATRLCPTVKSKPPAVSVYMPKQSGVGKPVQVQLVVDTQQGDAETRSVPVPSGPQPGDQCDKALNRILMISTTVWNVQSLNRIDHQVAVRNLISENRLSLVGLLETRVSVANFARVQRGLLPRWTWFVDYTASGNRIWLAWDSDFVGIDILEVDVQFIHYRIQMHCFHTSVLMTFVYGVNNVGGRRVLWQNLSRISASVGDTPWLVGGDFNTVIDESESQCPNIRPFSTRPERALSVSCCEYVPFYLTLSSDFTATVQGVWRNSIVGTAMFAVTRKLKALKPIFRAHRQRKVIFRIMSNLQLLSLKQLRRYLPRTD